MKALTVSLLSLAFLAGCSGTRASLDSAVNDVVDTASGRLKEVKIRFDDAIKPVVETVNTVNEGVKKAQSGAAMLKDGIDTIKGVVKP